MKALLVNGSPHAAGSTFTALQEVAKTLQQDGIETEIFQIGTMPVRGCIACQKCRELGRCVFNDDLANELSRKMQEADAVVLGSPVYYAGPNGALCALLDRAFFQGSRKFDHKLGASVVCCRRGGASAAFDRLNKYFMINNMHVVSSQYWNSVHGYCAEDVKQDLEGLQTMRTLGHNMAHLLKCDVTDRTVAPEREPWQCTSFIR